MRVALAPMDGITDCAYRTICKEVFLRHQAPEDTLMLWTEFMSADGYIHAPAGVVHHILSSDFEPELIVQIFGGNPETLTECAQSLVTTYHFPDIEINMGCPSPSVMKCGAWSALLKDKKNALSLLKHLAGAGMRLSLKTRVGIDEADSSEQFAFLCEAAQYVWLIAVHGRTYQQGHAWSVDWDFIYRLKQELPNTVVLGNGGIRTYQQAVETRQNLDGVMIAQSAIGNPWILTPHIPSPAEKYAVITRHLDLMMVCERWLNHYAKPDVLPLRQPTIAELADLITALHAGTLVYERCATPREFRKHLFAYVNGLPDNKACKQAVAKIDDYSTLRVCLTDYFDRLALA